VEQISVRERIDSNIKDIKDQINQLSHYIKALIRESLAHLQPLNSNFAHTQQFNVGNRLTHVDMAQLN